MSLEIEKKKLESLKQLIPQLDEFSEVKQCTHLNQLPEGFKWDTSEVTELKTLEKMNKVQAKYCFDNNLLYNYPFGMAAIIDGEIKEWFNSL